MWEVREQWPNITKTVEAENAIEAVQKVWMCPKGGLEMYPGMRMATRWIVSRVDDPKCVFSVRERW